MHIGYDGSQYRGWQWQGNVRSVQETIQQVFKKIFKKDITVYGCGRTDAGVHALQYIMHVHLPADINYDLKYRLNKNLPNDIAIYDIIKVEEGSHARFDANWRTYDYFLHFYPDAFISRYSSYYDFETQLDITAMKQATSLMTQYKDYRGVCRQPDVHNHTRCNVTHAHLYVSENGDRMRFSITANRFLKSMVRLCVFFLLEVGTRKMSVTEFENILSCKSESSTLKVAHPNGLYLTRVVYPYLAIEPKATFYPFLTVGLSE